MAIQRWEMLLSAQADCYLLKIQGDRVDVDRILQSHPQTCQSFQEISGDIFQWVIFIVDAPLSERLAIQNQVMSLTNDTTGEKPSEELLGILDGLSSAIQDLTNLTDDEQAFVMNKMARMGTPAPPLGAPPPTAPNPLQVPGRPPTPPGTYPPAGTPLPRVTIPGRLGSPLPPKSPSVPMGPGPAMPGKPGVGTPLPSPGPIPNIVRPVMPPRSFPGTPPGGPKMSGVPLPNPMPPIPMPKITPPPPPVPKNVAPATPSPLLPPTPIPEPQKPAVENILSETQKIQPTKPRELIEESKKIDTIVSIISTPLIEPLAFTPPPAAAPPAKLEIELSAPPSAPTEPVVPPPPSVAVEPAPPSVKTEDSAALRLSIFYPTGQESVMNHFLTTLTEVAQKKSKRPTAFQVALSVPTEVALENSTEWIWKAKTSGSDIFFVILPEGVGSEIMDPLVGEALSAGLRCFIVPQSEVASKLLYMDLMVELMMFKRRIRLPSA